MESKIRVLISRALAALGSGLAVWLVAALTRNHIAVDPQTVSDFSAAFVALLTAVATGSYGIIHKLLDKWWFNPSDTADPVVGVTPEAASLMKSPSPTTGTRL